MPDKEEERRASTNLDEDWWVPFPAAGIPVRAYLTGCAVQGILARSGELNGKRSVDEKDIALSAVFIADATIRVLENTTAP